MQECWHRSTSAVVYYCVGWNWLPHSRLRARDHDVNIFSSVPAAAACLSQMTRQMSVIMMMQSLPDGGSMTINQEH